MALAGKEKITFQLKLTMMSDWLIKGPTQQKYADAAPLLDGLNRPYVPASTLKGNLRYHVHRLLPILSLDEKIETELFGAGGTKQGSLCFEDCIANQPHRSTTTRIKNRIAINRRQRVVNDEALFIEETVAKGTTLTGNIVCYVKREEKEAIIALLTLAILQINFIGSGKTVGRGYQMIQYKQNEDTQSSTVTVLVEDQEIPYEEWYEIVKPYLGGALDENMEN